eukprot:403364590
MSISDNQSSQQLMIYQQSFLSQIFDEADLKWDPDVQIQKDKEKLMRELIKRLQLNANATWCMSCLILSSNENLNIFPSEKAIVRIVQFLSKHCGLFQRTFVDFLEVASRHSEKQRDLVIKAGAASVLSKIVNNAKPSTWAFYFGLRTLQSIFHLEPQPDQNILEVKVSTFFNHKNYAVFKLTAQCVNKMMEYDDQIKKKILIDMGVIEILVNNLCNEDIARTCDLEFLKDPLNFDIRIDTRNVIWNTLECITKNSNHCVQRFLESCALDKMLITFAYDNYNNLFSVVGTLESIVERISFQEAQYIIDKGVLKGLIQVYLCPKVMEGQIGNLCILNLLELMRDKYNQTEQSEQFLDFLNEHGLPQYLLQCKQAYSPGSGLRQLNYVLKKFCGKENDEYEEWKNHQFRDNKQHDFNYQIFEF